MFRPAYFRSPKLMKLARLLPCQAHQCGRDDGTVCGAHSNQLVDGKARGLKAPDFRIASLCHSCHSELDQGQLMTKAERVYLWDTAHIKTITEFLRREYLVLLPNLPPAAVDAWRLTWAKDPRGAVAEGFELGYLVVNPAIRA